MKYLNLCVAPPTTSRVPPTVEQPLRLRLRPCGSTHHKQGPAHCGATSEILRLRPGGSAPEGSAHHKQGPAHHGAASDTEAPPPKRRPQWLRPQMPRPRRLRPPGSVSLWSRPDHSSAPRDGWSGLVVPALDSGGSSQYWLGALGELSADLRVHLGDSVRRDSAGAQSRVCLH